LVKEYIRRFKSQNKKLAYQELKVKVNCKFIGLMTLDCLPSRSEPEQPSISVTMSSVCVYTCMRLVSGSQIAIFLWEY